MIKKIAYIIHDASPWILTEIRALKNTGLNPLVCICNSKEEALLTDDFFFIPTTIMRYFNAWFAILIWKPRSFWKLLRKIPPQVGWNLYSRMILFASIIKQHQITHIHAHFATTSTLMAMTIAELLSIEFSFTAHAYDIFRYDVDMAVLAEKCNAARFIRTVSQFHKRYLYEKLPTIHKKKIVVISYGVNIDLFHQQPVHKTHSYLILSVGNLVEKKGFTTLIAACDLLRNQRLDFQCCIIGDGELFHQLKVQVESLHLENYFKLLGKLKYSQLNIFYNQADVFVLPCIRTKNGDMDGIPNVLIEAMAAGTPVVSTSLSGIPELIEHEKSGLLVQPEDVNALSQAIIRLYNDKKFSQQLGQNGRKKIIKDFNIANVANSLNTIFINDSATKQMSLV